MKRSWLIAVGCLVAFHTVLCAARFVAGAHPMNLTLAIVNAFCFALLGHALDVDREIERLKAAGAVIRMQLDVLQRVRADALVQRRIVRL